MEYGKWNIYGEWIITKLLFPALRKRTKCAIFNSAMTLRTRKSIYYLFFILFFVVGAYLLMVTQGLVFDWAKFRVVKTGGIYLRTIPPNASILINKKPYQSESGFLSRGTFVSNLLPDTYHVEVFFPGYRDWQKDITVENGLVASASQIKLWKENYPETKIASSSIKDFFFTNKGLILQMDDGELNFNGTALKGTSIVANSPDSAETVTEDAKGNYLLTDLGNLKSSLNVTSLFTSLYKRTFIATSTPEIVDIALHPFSTSKLLIAADNGMYLLDVKKIQLEQSVALPLTNRLIMTDNEVFAADAKGNFFGTNLLLSTSAYFSVATTSVANVKANQSGTKFFVLEKNGTLFEYNRGTGTSTVIAEKIKDFYLGPDEKRLALVDNDNTIKIYYLTETTGDLHIPQGSSIPIIIPNILKNSNIKLTWLPDTLNYLLVAVNGDIFSAEVDPRVPENSYLLFSHIKKYTLNGALYLLKNDGSLVTVIL